MPFKDKNKLQEYQQKWYQRKKSGLPTKIRTKLTNDEQVEHEKQSRKKWKKNRTQIRQERITNKFGDKCAICNDNYRLQIHRKDGEKHTVWISMNNEEFELLIASDEYVQLCFNCHKSVHWCMYYLGMVWNDIKQRIITNISEIKNKYHA